MLTESNFLHHTSCPNCGSKDNLGVYTDHEFCFGCGYTKKYNQTYKPKVIVEPKTIDLPYDVEPFVPAITDTWLRKYELTNAELVYNRVLWSEFRQLLIFPYFGERNQLVGWQGRYFGKDPKHPKWFSKGNLNHIINLIDLSDNKEHGIIFVEDIISAIKVGRQFAAVPLFGSFVSKINVIRLYKIYNINKYYIWLDYDKRKESMKYSVMINNLGFKSKSIITNKDPKEYSTIDIYNIINES